MIFIICNNENISFVYLGFYQDRPILKSKATKGLEIFYLHKI